ncbi:16S rRNA (cytosine(1402)-N(4))-methyltransferase RsmH [Candidatus Bipolaricaulota bacterium]|nr:16S rRNA (cytosine(1402)-N(4))-methyltransferase RsmH [Candidatus Bipolaricaulota bacterium]
MSSGSSARWHEPVMVQEVLRFLDPRPGKLVVDATVGTGGHAEAILERGAELIGIDRDPLALEVARERLSRFGDRCRLIQGNFRDLYEILRNQGIEEADGVLFDLGMSSFQLEDPKRGFSFLKEGPLDMRMDPSQDLTAYEIVNRWPEQDIARILREHGEERYAGRIARAIVKSRPIETTTQLARIVAHCYPPGYHRIHPATRTFQALRIAVNDELNALREGLLAAIKVLRPGGVVVAISFHSLEDRIVKRTFRQRWIAGEVEILTKKPLTPTAEEVEKNPRSRSAKLRAARKPPF